MFLNSLKQNKRKGFTIIELLVTISIIGLLSTISVVALNGPRIKSRDAKRINDIDSIKKAIELYYDDKGEYPIAISPISLGTTNTLVLCDAGFVASASSCSGKIYMGKVPKNPTPNGIEYTYVFTSGSENYSLAYVLEKGIESIPSGYNISGDGGDVVSYGLVIYSPLNNVDRANDVSGNNNNGIVYNSVPTTGIDGQDGGAYNFNSTTSYINYNNNDSINSESLSVSFWVNHRNYTVVSNFMCPELWISLYNSL